MFSKIQVLLATSRFEEAEAMIRSELSRDQCDSYLYILLARVLVDQRKFQAARVAVSEAIRLEPDEPDAYYTLAVICR